MKSLLVAALALAAPDRAVITQTSCTSLEGRGLEEAKKELLQDARRGAVEQLFGSLVTSLTQVENLALKKDEIQAASLGYVRLEGGPSFFNGQSLGELCVRIQAYATEEDRAKLKPKELSKKTCAAEGDVTTIRKRTEEKAILEALTDYDGALKKLPPARVLPLLHEVRFSEGGFVPETTTYCVRVAGTLYPVEAITSLTLNHEAGEGDAEATVSGLRGEYFNIPPFEEGASPTFPSLPESERIDRQINFDWGDGAPALRISADFFYVRWSGELYAPVTGTYQFQSDHNEGARLLIDGKLVLQDWFTDTAVKSQSVPSNRVGGEVLSSDIYLEGGRWHRIEFEFLERRSYAFVQLSWRPPGEGGLRIIPPESFRTRAE